MTTAEMKLENERQMHRLNAQELDTKSNQLNQIMDIIDNHIQRHDDTFRLSNDTKVRDATYYKVKALRDIKKEIMTIMEREE